MAALYSTLRPAMAPPRNVARRDDDLADHPHEYGADQHQNQSADDRRQLAARVHHHQQAEDDAEGEADPKHDLDDERRHHAPKSQEIPHRRPLQASARARGELRL